MSCPSSIRHRDSNPRPLECESTPITTRPGLPPTHFCLSTSFCKAKNTLEYIVSLKRQLGFMLKNILECLPSTSFAELFLYFTTDKRKFLSPAAVIGKTLKIVTSKIAKINFEDNRAGEVNFCDLKIDCDFTAISQVSNKVIFQV